MLSLTIFLPLAGAVAVLVLGRAGIAVVRATALAAAGATLVLALALWFGFEPGGGLQFAQRQPWIESLGVGYAVAIDGLSAPLMLLTAIVFAAALLFSWTENRRVPEYYFWFLFLETACLGVFAAQDLFLFYIFWDLTLVGMYFVIAIWGHEGARDAALKFFLYTFVGSLALLLGIIGLYLGTAPHTMDMAAITDAAPYAERATGGLAALVFFGLLIGLGIKIPSVPVHTWLPPAHADAPAPGSAVLAGILLKMGTYGLFRILLPMMPEASRHWGWVIVALGVASILWGALAALAQSDLKRLIAYTSVNHMGYIVLAAGVVALGLGGPQARVLAIDGAVVQMVSHGLITGALFLLAGSIFHRAGTFDIARFGGLAGTVPVLTGAFGLAAFASLGLPGLSGFVAEFQIFVGVFGAEPVIAAIALLGVLITAGLFLWTLQRVFLGELPERWEGMRDLAWHERAALFPMLALVVAIGLMPSIVLDVIVPFGRSLATALAPDAAVTGAG